MAAAACTALAAGPLAAKVNGVEITAEQVEALSTYGAKQTGFKLKPGYATEQLIYRELLAQEAIRKGADKNADRGELASATYQAYAAAHPLGEEDLKKEYARLKAEAPRKMEYLVSFILVKTDAEAKAIIAGLDAGKPFSSFVARSIDENSKREGGSLGWTDPASLSRSYAYAIPQLKAGAHSKAPLVESFGYGVIKVEDTRQESFPAYAELRDGLMEQVKTRWQEGLFKPLRDKATIEVFEGYENKVIDLRNPK